MQVIKMKSQLVLISIILLSTAFDALRDGLLGSVDWLAWHTIKWIAFFPPLVYLWFRLDSWYVRILLPIVSFIIWRVLYEGVSL